MTDRKIVGEMVSTGGPWPHRRIRTSTEVAVAERMRRHTAQADGGDAQAARDGRDAAGPAGDLTQALDHLGAVLYVLADLSPSDRCQALDEALEFYNGQRPDHQIGPSDGFVSRLVQVGPADWPRPPR